MRLPWTQSDSGTTNTTRTSDAAPPEQPIEAPRPVQATKAPEAPVEKPAVEKPPVVTSASLLDTIGRQSETLRIDINQMMQRFTSISEMQADFDRLVSSFGQAVDTYETDKTKFVETERLLQRERAALDDARSEMRRLHQQLEAQGHAGALLAADVGRLQASLREKETALETAEINLRERTERLAEIEKQLSQMQDKQQIIVDENASLRREIETNDISIGRLENDLAEAKHKVSLTENENKRFKDTAAEAGERIAVLTSRMQDLEPQLESARQQVRMLEAKLTGEQAELEKLRVTREQDRSKTASEMATLQSRIEASETRIAAADQLLTETRDELRKKIDLLRASERQLKDVSLQLNSAQKKLKAAEKEAAVQLAQIADLEQSRVALVERSTSLMKTVTAKDNELGQAANKLAVATERLEDMEARLSHERDTRKAEVDRLTEQLEKERSDRAIAEGALAAARKERLQLQMEITNLKGERRQATHGMGGVLAAEEQEPQRPDNVTPFDAARRPA